MNSHEVFIHIHQGCLAGTGAIVRLPQCQWSKPDGFWKISQCITTTKHNKAKTVRIFLGIYCSTWRATVSTMATWSALPWLCWNFLPPSKAELMFSATAAYCCDEQLWHQSIGPEMSCSTPQMPCLGIQFLSPSEGFFQHPLLHWRFCSISEHVQVVEKLRHWWQKVTDGLIWNIWYGYSSRTPQSRVSSDAS